MKGPCPGLARNPWDFPGPRSRMSCEDLTRLTGNCWCGKKKRNPAARQEFVDDLTGHRISGLTYGATRTPQKVVRTRPAKGRPFQTIETEDYTLDSRRDTFGIDPQFDESYADLAAKKEKAEAKARKKPPMPRNADVEIGRLGISTTFKSVDDALRQIEDLNPAYFENRLLDDLDASDVTRDFMDRVEVAKGGRGKRRFAKLSTLPRGQEILEAKGIEQIRAMLRYFFGTAKGKRWRNVPWSAIDSYIEQVSRAIADESKRQRISGGVVGLENYPLASSKESSDEFVARVAQEVGPAAAQKIADIRNSQALWNAVGRLEEILKPPKGNRVAQRTLKCIPKDARKLLRSRIRTLTEWAKWPNLVPTWACVPDMRFESAMLCTHAAILEDVRKIENACAEPYDVTWPAQLRQDLWDENGEVAVGVYPMGRASPSPSDFQYAPEERLAVPWETAANPRRQSLKRRLMR